MVKILVVDDDAEVLDEVRRVLQDEGFTIFSATDGPSALSAASEHEPDVVLLDIDLPYDSSKSGERLDGVHVLRRLRKRSDVGVLMLTSSALTSMKILTLEMGADDYITKPFESGELVARVKSILRRVKAEGVGDEALIFGALRIEPSARKVFKQESEIELTPIEYDLLLTLASRPGLAYSRQQIIDAVWKGEYVGDERIVDTHVSSLRKKIEDDASNPDLIVTVRGFGYRLESITA